MKNYRVTFMPEGKEVDVAAGTNLLDAAALAGIEIRAICGGTGGCRRCAGIIKSGSYEVAGDYIEKQAGDGLVLCCQTTVKGDLIVEIPSSSRMEEASVLIEGEAELTDFEPLTRTISLQLPPPELGKNASDLTRLKKALAKETGTEKIVFSRDDVDKLPAVLRQNDWHLDVTIADLGSHLVVTEISGYKKSEKKYGLAVDIGTTTIVASLISLDNGAEVARRGRYNKQGRYGDDIISRIVYAVDEKDGRAKLQNAVVETIKELLTDIEQESGVNSQAIQTVTCAGNTTMVHLFLNVDPKYIRLEPYVPAATAPPPVKAVEIGLPVSPEAFVYCIPGIGSYVGGDITSGLLATGVADNEETVLFLDIGTNGELVLGSKDWLLACACSAGPAFEGSGTACGMRATKGAIESFSSSENGSTIKYRTIGNEPPKGICGSGFISLLGTLAEAGILDRRGSFTSDIADRMLKQSDGEKELVLVESGKSKTGAQIVIREGDIENLLRAKAALFAGIRIMLNKLQLDLAIVDRILVAGGFGNHLPIAEAVRIGLLPDIDKDKFFFVGNTSLAGARAYLLSRRAREKAHEIAEKMTYLELSDGNEFTEEFISAMFIPHTDFSLFPSITKKEG